MTVIQEMEAVSYGKTMEIRSQILEHSIESRSDPKTGSLSAPDSEAISNVS